MKKTINFILLLAVAALFLTSCKEEHADVAPGLWVSSDRIGTYQGDTPLVSGTVSGYTALSAVTFKVAAWDYTYRIDLGGQRPKVFNYSFRASVPEGASLPQDMSVTVTDEAGNSTSGTVVLYFEPDTTSPWPDWTVNDVVEVVYEGTEGVWKAVYSFTDDRSLASVGISIPELGVDDTLSYSGKTGTFSKVYTFPSVGTFTAVLSASDATGNVFTKELSLVVMPREEEDEIKDYEQMYLWDADENADDYLSGFYHYMERDAACCYKVNFYASHDDFHILFAPKASGDGDIYGASPYIPTKLMNKSGYVVPVTVEKKGYYGIYLDLMNHRFTLWEFDVTSAYDGAPYTGPLRASGTGFSIGDWGIPDQDMTKVDGHDYIFTTRLQTVQYSDARDYYFANTSAWDPIFRCDNSGHSWYVYASGPCCQFSTDYVGTVDLYLDTAIPWGWIKIAQ